MSIDFAIAIHCLTLAMVLGIVSFALSRNGLLTFMSSGTWILFACALYLFVNPALSLIQGDLDVYSEALVDYTGEGEGRVFWMLFVLVVGLVVFFATYLAGSRETNTRRTISCQPQKLRWSSPTVVAVTVFIVVGVLAILYFQTAGQFVDREAPAAEFDRGHVVGGVTGYSLIAYKFFVLPTILLIFRGPKVARRIGIVLALFFVLIRLYDTSDRASSISMIVTVAMVAIALGKWRTHGIAKDTSLTFLGRAKRLVPFIAAAGLALVLVIRGHASISQWQESEDKNVGQVLLRNDTAMLPTLYARSNMIERIGFDYGVPLLTSALFGWLPRQYFPWKDDLTGILLNQNSRTTTPSDNRWIDGTKWTLMGSFYDHGGLIGVVVGMFGLGLATRKLDWLVASSKTDLGRVLGIGWMAQLWIMFASSDVWVLNVMFTTALPFFAIWVTIKLQPLPRLAVKGDSSGANVASLAAENTTYARQDG